MGMKATEDILWAVHSRGEFAALAAQGAVVIVPIGSTEQHGMHLPVDTDCRTVEAVAYRAARLLDDVPVLVTPTIPFGVSPHHMMYPGTISLSVRTAVQLLREVCQSILAHGFDRILILSGHGGNGGTVSAAALELSHQLKRPILGLSWFDLVNLEIDTIREGPQPGIGHAGEIETSIILATAPQHVRRERLARVDGISDNPARGTAAKGEQVVQAGAEALLRLLRRLAAMPPQEPVGVVAAPEE